MPTLAVGTSMSVLLLMIILINNNIIMQVMTNIDKGGWPVTMISVTLPPSIPSGNRLPPRRREPPSAVQPR